MKGKYIYSVSLQQLNGVDTNEPDKPMKEVVIQTYDNLDAAIDKLVELGKKVDPYWEGNDADYIKRCIEEGREHFDRGLAYRNIYEKVEYYGLQHCYIGPGAYTLRKGILQ